MQESQLIARFRGELKNSGRFSFARVKNKQRGAGAIEIVAIAAALIPLSLAGVQVALMYNAKGVLNNATFEAARVGAVENAKVEPMKEALARNLIPLYGGGTDATSIAKSYGTAYLDLKAPATGSALSGAGLKVEVLNPTKQAFVDFGHDDTNGNRAIPNSHLKYRERDIGSHSGVNIQDANLLKIKVTYGYRLFVPVVNKVIGQAMAIIDSENSAYYLADPPRIPIEATATVRMHSPAYLADNVSFEPGNGGGTIPKTGGGTVPPADDESGAGGGNSPASDLTVALPSRDSKAEDSFWDPNAPCSGSNCNPGNPFSCAANDSTSSVGSAPGQSVGNPINVTTGNKYQREVDLPALPGTLGLQFTRHYNSLASKNGVLGYGWTHSYDVTLSDKSAQFVTVRQSDGRIVSFDRVDGKNLVARMASDGWLEQSANNYLWRWRDGKTFQFDRKGRLERVTAPSGETLHLTYNANGDLVQVADPQSRSLGFDYYKNGRMKTVIGPAGKVVRYSYDLAGNLDVAQYPDGTTRRFHYEDSRFSHHLTGITDGRNVRYATWAYDDVGRAVLSTHAKGVGQVRLQYEGKKVHVTNSQGIASTYELARISGMTLVKRIVGPGCSTCGSGDVEYTYTSRAQLASVRTKGRPERRYEYDNVGRLTEIADIDSSGQKTQVASYVYQGSDHEPRVIMEPSVYKGKKHAWFLTYNQAKQITEITETGWSSDLSDGFQGLRRTTTFEYSDGRLASVDGPVPGAVDRVSYEFDAYGRSVAVNYPDGSSDKVLSYDAYGRVSRRMDAHGNETVIDYDLRGRPSVVKIAEASGITNTVTLTYDGAGQISSITGIDDKTSKAEYDEAGRPVAILGPDGKRYEWTWDTEERVTRQHFLAADGSSIQDLSYTYGSSGEVIDARTGNDRVASYEYDRAGRIKSWIDAVQGRVSFDYDENGLLKRRTRAAGTASAVDEEYTYDSRGRITGFVDARGNQSTQEFDDFGNRLFAATPDGGVVVFRYNARGQVIARVDESGVITRYDYGESGRLLGLGVFQEPASIKYQHIDQKLASIESPRQKTEFEYGSNGRVKEKRVRINGVEKQLVTKYRYDRQGRLIGKTLPDGQELVFYFDESSGRLVEVARGRWFRDADLVRFKFDGADRLTGISFAGGDSLDMVYDGQGRLSELNSGATGQVSYSYDRLNRLVAEKRQATSKAYAYDSLGRLTESTATGLESRWTYDAVGNRLLEVKNGQSTELVYSATSNRLLKAGDDELEYTATGAPTRKGELRYEYMGGSRPMKIYRGDQLLAEYSYNSDGERIKKIDYTEVPARITHYLYEHGKLSAELDPAGKVSAQYIYIGHRPLAKLEGNSVFSILADQRGAPVAVTDQEGRKIWTADYAAFGEANVNDDADGDGRRFVLNLRLPGQYYDAETGTYYNLHRDYDPALGRYLTADPIGITAGANMYAYVQNDPLNRIDPLGLYDEMVHYYMTYFLAVTAGIPEDTAHVISTATQYIDNNPLTSPLIGGSAALDRYHFTLDYDSGFHGDASDNIRSRFARPESAQLVRLHTSAMDFNYDGCLIRGRVSTRAVKAQLYGEYLHAYEDTFAHRDTNNKPYDKFNALENEPAGGIGHMFAGHRPDRTYNQRYVSSSQVGSRGSFRQSVEEWSYNELRTLTMEREVFELFQRDFATEIAQNGSGAVVSWSDLAGAGDARIGVLGASVYSNPGTGAVLQQFNQEMDYGAKKSILSGWLERKGFKPIPEYEVHDGARNRNEILGGFGKNDIDGILLPCRKRTARGCID